MPKTCFQDAVEIASMLGPTAVIVHGTPIGTGAENLGQRYWHAWVEFRGDAYVRSPQHQHGVSQIPLGLFYRTGHIEPEHCHRFSLTRARTEMTVRGHFGPWVSQ